MVATSVATAAPVLVVGAGPAGLTLARSLALRGRAVRVFDAQVHRPDRGLGIWGRAQAALRALGHGKILDSASTTLRIPAAAYRNRRGEWLSRSSDNEANRRRVATLRESVLLADLERGLPEGTVQRGARLTAVEQGEVGGTPSTAVTLRFADGTCAEGAAVVGADGACSAVRRLAFGEGMNEVHTSMISYGGILSPLAVANLTTSGGRTDSAEGSSPTAHAFETLSSGRRFACVPLADGGAFWFATMPEAHMLAMAGTVGGEGAIPALREAYEGWHAPIPRMLHAVACSAAEAAMSSAEPRSEQSSVAATLESSGILRAERLFVAPASLAQWWTGRAVLVGDAAHALPINLAQGAACGIEGAYLLGESIHRHDGSHDLGAAFAEYQAAHEPRVRQCRAVTAFTGALASPASGPTEALRDAMRFVPQPLNGMVFDTALELSLGDRPEGTRRRWPLPVACE